MNFTKLGVSAFTFAFLFAPAISHSEDWYLIDQNSNVKFFSDKESIRYFADGTVGIYALTAVKGPPRDYGIDYFNFRCQQAEYGIPYLMKIRSTEIIDRWGNVLEYIAGTDSFSPIADGSPAEVLAYFACHETSKKNVMRYSFKSELLTAIVKEWGE